MDQDLHYNFDIERIRGQEFPNLKDVTYVDHVGTTLYARSQIEAYHEDLLKNIYGNPHSRSQSSRLTTDTIDQVRFRILQFFNASPDEYSVIFTSGCTSALKLVAETFSFYEETSDLHQETSNTQLDRFAPTDGETSRKHENSDTQTSGDGTTRDETRSAGWFVYLLDNHTSVQGMRELVFDRASGVFCLDEDELQQQVPQHLNQKLSSNLSARSSQGLGLAGESTQVDGTVNNQKSNPLSLSTENPNQMRVSNQSPSDQTHHHNQSQNVQIDHTSPKVRGCAERFKHISTPCHLFAYPAQSNFSGRKYPLEWIKEIQDGHFGFQKRVVGRWFVVLDAASYVSSSKLDLQKYKPDFVTVSFYKIFGFPTGLGALLVRKRAEPMLDKHYFGGGTVAVSNAKERFHVFRSPIADRFEDGTVSFLDIIALRHGLDVIHRLAGNMERVSQHTFSIARYFHDRLLSLRHGAGGPVAQVYGPGFEDISRQGAIVNFNILKQDGQFVGFAEVDKLAQLHDIHLRTGCFCNIGACQKHLSLTSQQIRDNFDAGHVCGDDRDMIEGQPTGSIRVSFGYMSTFEDASQCLKFIAACFLEGVSQTPDFEPPIQSSNISSDPISSWSNHENKGANPDKPHGGDISAHKDLVTKDVYSSGVDPELQKVEEEVLGRCGEQERYLTKICLYPVKSCAAFQVYEWEVGPRGLVYDREWMIVSESGVTLGQKREPKLCLLQPRIDFLSNSLTLSFPDTPSFTLSLFGPDGGQDVEGRLCTNKVCGDRVNTYDCGDAVADWLSDILGRPGTRLLRQNQTDGRTGKLKDLSGQGSSEKMKLSLANESQFLLISRESVRSLQKHMLDQEQPDSKLDREHGSPDIDNLIHRFRGNLVVGGGSSFEEEQWGEVVIGTFNLVSQGQCSRCQMVCMDQQTGERSREPLRTLVSWRGKKVPFGVYMRRQSCPVKTESSVTLRVGDLVVPRTRAQ